MTEALLSPGHPDELGPPLAAASPVTPYEAYVAERLDRLEGRIREARRDCSEASIHQLRVDIKMLRAGLAVLRTIDPAGAVRSSARPVRRLFRAAGPLRDGHVHRLLFSEHVGPGTLDLPEWIHVLTAREMQARRLFLGTVRTWKAGIAKGVTDAVRIVAAPLGDADVEWQVRSEFAVAVSRLADLQQEQDWSDVDLHRVRRLAKDARYTLGVLCALSGKRDDAWTDLDRSLHQVHRALGGWHDTTVVAGELSTFLAGRDGAPLRHPEIYSHYERRLREAQAAYRLRFDEAWKNFLAVLESGRTAAS